MKLYFQITVCIESINSKAVISLLKYIFLSKSGWSAKNVFESILIIPCCCLAATVRKIDPLVQSDLADFGRYVAECIPKYVQKVQIYNGDELSFMIHPDGVVPVMTFLKDHSQAQFLMITDIAGVDMPSRENRFEVRTSSGFLGIDKI